MALAHRLVTSRSGTVALAALAAVAAGVAVLVYVNHYRSTVGEGGAPATVLVAKEPIPKGMSAATALAAGSFELRTMRTEQLSNGAVADAAVLRDRVATRDVLPGEQITTAEFGTTAGGLATRLEGSQRAISIALDSEHSLAGQLQKGDHVDVVVGFNAQSLTTGVSQPVVTTLFQDLPVLQIVHPDTAVGTQSGGSVLLRVTTAQAAKIAYAAENGKVWLVLRPRVGAPKATASLVTLQSLLAGTKPVVVGGR